MKKKLLNVIYSSIDEINSSLPINSKIDKNEHTVIFGEGKIDSLAFVNFIISIEENVNKEFRASIDLTNEEMLMEDSSPFQTVNTLANYIERLLTKHN